jgi:hypothetical protein
MGYKSINRAENGLIMKVANSQTVDNVNLAIIIAMRNGLPLFFAARQLYWTRSQSDTPHSVGLLWMSDRPFADTST